MTNRSLFFIEFPDFVMNYAENGELLKLLTLVGSFDEESTRFFAAEILLALEHLHRLNIVHRDLSRCFAFCFARRFAKTDRFLLFVFFILYRRTFC